MFALETTQKCRDQIRKLTSKNRALGKTLRDKIRQIEKNPEHFKPLGNVLKGKRRVHIAGCFVLIYEIDFEAQSVRLLHFSHHDDAY